MKAGDRLGGAAALFQCACGTFLGGVFGNVLPHGRVVRRMGVFVSAWVWRPARAVVRAGLPVLCFPSIALLWSVALLL